MLSADKNKTRPLFIGIPGKGGKNTKQGTTTRLETSRKGPECGTVAGFPEPGPVPQQFCCEHYGIIATFGCNLQIDCPASAINYSWSVFPSAVKHSALEFPASQQDSPTVIGLMCCLLLLLASRSPPQPLSVNQPFFLREDEARRSRRGVIGGESAVSLVKAVRRREGMRPPTAAGTAPDGLSCLSRGGRQRWGGGGGDRAWTRVRFITLVGSCPALRDGRFHPSVCC